MNAIAIRYWISALRSGVYRRCTSVYGLQDKFACCYCATGVAMELFHKQIDIQRRVIGRQITYSHSGRCVEDVLARFLGIDTDYLCNIANANDHGASFDDTADKLERELYYEGVFKPRFSTGYFVDECMPWSKFGDNKRPVICSSVLRRLTGSRKSTEWRIRVSADETKFKHKLTLDYCGIGWFEDESGPMELLPKCGPTLRALCPFNAQSNILSFEIEALN